ncbi:uncharacterized protein PRCAT00006320001 [Priceomyces carsonii]|uniref:uncharacterized protein n=1 Tax=Priceomyces carsonii TaxID=28549 RepID=UPI002ED84244|nr:unnamed protein product [Priceomyces carsonii]
MSIPSESNTLMWRLDLLETKFSNLNPRFPRTKILLQARSNEKLLKKLPISKQEAELEIKALKQEAFVRKYYAADKKLRKKVQKTVKDDLSSLKSQASKKSIYEFLSNEKNVEHLITSRLVKLISTAILVNRELKTNPPNYIPEDIRNIIIDKSNNSNPSAFFIKFCKDDKQTNSYISSLWNSKPIKSLLDDIEWSFKLVRGNLTKQEREDRKKVPEKNQNSHVIDANSESDDENDDESDSQNESEQPSADDISEDNEAEGSEDNIDPDEAYEKLLAYDNLVGDSDSEGETNLDPNIDYNEVTDIESSNSESDIDISLSGDDDDNDDSGDRRHKSDLTESNQYKLPELAVGYYSGGSDDDDDDDDIDNDKLVKEATGTQRKNRRGQRARQKIWAQKYGKDATHVKKEKERVIGERERKRLEYEERCRKRELKAKLAAQPVATSSNMSALGQRKSQPTIESGGQETMKSDDNVHPSWAAKKREEEKLKNIKFTGKKITFD